jgi:two-component system sensor histidine kinase KdpD
MITISTRVSGGLLEIVVRDRGPGIPPGDLERIFERFYRRPQPSDRFGRGLGLAITRGLIAAEGGRVTAANHPAGGAMFTIQVPVESRPLPDVDDEGT